VACRWRVLVVLVGLSCLFEGCTRFQMFRPVAPQERPPVCKFTGGADCAQATLLESDDYLLGFVEFDDLGWYWNPDQKKAVVKAVRNVARTEDVVMVAFAHGWNHDSNARDGNVQDFQQILGQLAALERQSAKRKCLTPRRIVGIYMGWRGKAFKRVGGWPANLYNWTSFFSRKAVAHRVGSEDAAELLADLERVRNEANATGRSAPHSNRLVVVGHSFGGAVVYGAVSRILAERRIRLSEEGIEAASFGDLVVLVNPAIEASLLFPFDRATERYTRSEKRETSDFHPIMAVFASQGDTPNRVWFPIGRRLATLLEYHRDESPPGFEPHFQGVAVRKAVGQFQPTISFVLCPADETAVGLKCQPKPQSRPALQAPTEGSVDYPAAESQLRDLRDAQSRAEAFQKGDLEALPLSTSTLIRVRPGAMTPYPIVSVDARLIPNHNAIFTDFFAPFLIDFVSVWAPPKPSRCGPGQEPAAGGTE
jgi:pimeloyl-ACP methyl ester carboxylesterase